MWNVTGGTYNSKDGVALTLKCYWITYMAERTVACVSCSESMRRTNGVANEAREKRFFVYMNVISIFFKSENGVYRAITTFVYREALFCEQPIS
jgi:hypothetical protein